jgi:uncharacterized protein YceH (UPF0502 family)
MSAGDRLNGWHDILRQLYPNTYQAPQTTREQDIAIDHERRITDLEKQVAELRAALAEKGQDNE